VPLRAATDSSFFLNLSNASVELPDLEPADLGGAGCLFSDPQLTVGSSRLVPGLRAIRRFLAQSA